MCGSANGLGHENIVMKGDFLIGQLQKIPQEVLLEPDDSPPDFGKLPDRIPNLGAVERLAAVVFWLGERSTQINGYRSARLIKFNFAYL